ncbi:MAG: response regulator [Lewinellaceae bacterium]|nr:response regulator [Lewinellaceae bacterium]
MLNNLISNALKFTPAAGRVVVSVLSASDLGAIEIRVADTGIGIAPENLGKIFERFYQVDGSNTRAGAGTGIGLALSKELAELMSGGIQVESELGKGSVFTFWIPASASLQLQPPAPLETGTEAGRGPGAAEVEAETEAPLVLLIEDNAELRGFIRQCIGGAWQIAEASDGAEGVKKALKLIPDLVISDVAMPRMDGFEVCDELKNNELTSHIPLILLTAKSTTESRIRGLRTGADDYLTKPFNTDELLARMTNLVETRRRLQQRYSQALAESGMAQPIAAATDQTDFLTAPDRQFLQRFTAMVEQHLSDEQIGVEGFAKKMQLGRVQLHRKLKALTDQNVSDFVHDYRLDRAMAMLKNREGMVYEVRHG